MATASTIITNPDFNRASSVYDFTVKTSAGEKCRLDAYRGHVCLIVNVASESETTTARVEFRLLKELHGKFYEKGLRILAFPCTQFGNQLRRGFIPTRENLGVQFDVFEAVDVNGIAACPLWKYLKYTVGNGGARGGVIKNNFTKFVTNKLGMPQERLGPEVSMDKLEQAMEMYL